MTRKEYKKRYMQDVNAHKDAEQIALEVFNNLNNGYVYEDVADDGKYFSKGDIVMVKEGVNPRFIDVKDDHEIEKTGNFHVEAGGYSKIYGTKKAGWIDSNYNYVAVVSQEENIIWLLSFKQLKKYYNKTDITGGREVKSEFWDNVKYGYLIPIYKAIELDIVLAKIEYEYDDFIEEYIHTKYITKTELKAAQTEAA